jgi:hypothetical protein
VFRTRITRDVDADGNRDLIAGVSYGCRGPDGSEGCPRGGGLLPVAISWDDHNQRYRLVSLNLRQPQIQRPVTASDRAEYGTYVRFTDPADHRSVGGYRVENFSVTKGNQPRLIGAYRTGPPGGPRYELHAWRFDSTYATPHVTPCPLIRRSPTMGVAGQYYSVAVNLVSTWRKHGPTECR